MPLATRPSRRADEPATPTAMVTAARRLNRAAGTIAASVLIDSAMEHYRGNFHNKAMWTPIVTSSLSIAVSVHGLSDQRHGAHPVRDVVYAAAGIVGVDRHGISHLQRHQEGRRLQLAEHLLFRAARRAGGDVAVGADGVPRRARARQRAARASPTCSACPPARVVAATTGGVVARRRPPRRGCSIFAAPSTIPRCCCR